MLKAECWYLGLQNPELSNKNFNSLFYQFHIWQVAFEFWEWNYERQARNIGARLVTSIENERMADNTVIFKNK